MVLPALPEAPETALQFFAHGKLLLSGEYAVLDGALALGLPTRLGQTLRIETAGAAGGLEWVSLDRDRQPWFEATFDLPGPRVRHSSSPEVAERLTQLLRSAGADQWVANGGIRATTQVGFPLHWGLGSSSSLVTLVAQWAQADPYRLLDESFGGSGYDVACAKAPGPVLYQRTNGQSQAVLVPFLPPCRHQMYFVGLNQKQSSRDGVARYREHAIANPHFVDTVSQLTLRFLCVQDLAGMESLIWEHERLVAAAIGLPRAKAIHFHDYWGEVKSLGAWGGDFVLVTSDRPTAETRDYFAERGYHDFFPYPELILGANA